MSTAVRFVSPELHATFIVVLRNFLTLLILLPWALRGRGAAIRTQRIGAHAWRGAIGSIGMITWTYAITIMPLTHATALSFTAPLFSTLFAVLLLKEKADRTRWMLLLAGFGGTLVILRPSVAGFDWTSLLVIFSTSTWAVTWLFVKSLSRTEPPLRMVFYMSFFMLLMALPPSIPYWKMPSLHAWGVLMVIALCSIVMHFFMARAYSLAAMVSLMPFDFTRLISTAIFAYLLFGETSDAGTWLGAAIITISAVLMARRDVRARSPRTV